MSYSVEAVLRASGTEEFKQAFKEAEDSVKGFENVGKSIGEVGKGMSKWVTGPIVGATAGLFALTNSAANTADELYDMAQKTGVGIESLQELQYWGDQNGISMGNIEKATGRLNQRMGMAVEGNEKYSKALTALGVNMNDVENGTISTEEAFATSISTLSQMENSQEQAALASELFGTKLSRELMPAITEGATSIEDATEMAREMGLVMSEDGVIAADQYAQQISDLKQQFGAVFREVGENLIPIFSDVLLPLIQETLIPAFRTFMDYIGGLIERFTNLSPETQKTIAIIVALVAAIGPVLVVLGKVITIVSSTIATFSGLFGAIKASGGAFAILSNPIGLAIAAIAAITAVVVTLWKTNEDFRDKVIEIWEKIKSMFETVLGFIQDLVTKVVEKVRKLWEDNSEKIREATQKIWEAITLIFNTALDLISKAIDVFVSAAKKWWEIFGDAIISITKGAWNVIKTVFETVLDVIIGVVDAFIGLFTGDWNRFTDGLKSVWDSIWNAIEDIVSTIINTVYDVVSSVIENMRKFVSDKLEAIKAKFSEIWEAVKTATTEAFSNVVSAVEDGIQSAYDTVTGWFDRFKEAGSNIVTSIADGISGAISLVTDAIGNVTSKIRDFLPFSPAKIGPLTDIHKLNFGGTIAGSIQDGQRTIQRAMNNALRMPNVGVNHTVTSSSATGSGIVQNIEINSTEPLSPSETARRMKQATRQLAMEW